MKKPPLFPQFKTITIADNEILKSFTQQFPSYSDFNFVSLFTWNVGQTASYSFLNNNLVIRIGDYHNKTLSVYSILGNNEVVSSVNTLFATLRINELVLVPNVIAEALGSSDSRYIITPQRDEFDYIYDIPSLVAMDGPGYRKIRRALSNFKSKNNINVSIEVVQEDDSESLNEILKLTRDWRTMKGRKYIESSFEYFAIRRAVRHIKQLPLSIYCFRLGGKIVAFSIIEKQNNLTVIHFEKSSVGIYQLGAYLKYEVLKILLQEGYTTLNYEQDLGIEGLRMHKMSLNPSIYLEKFSVKKMQR